MSWEVRLTDEAWADMKSLRRRRKKIHAAAEEQLQVLESDPLTGQPLVGDMEGLMSRHFWNDEYRIVWEIVPETATVIVHGVGRKKSGVYDWIRDRLRSP